jgi:hypothetical protein
MAILLMYVLMNISLIFYKLRKSIIAGSNMEPIPMAETYEWIIKSASLFLRQTEVDVPLYSPAFFLHGKWWAANFYIRGDQEGANSECASFYLMMLRDDDSIRVKWEVELSGNNPDNGTVLDSNESNFVKYKPWGYSKFVKWNNLSSHIRSDDTFHLFVTIEPT